MQFYKIYKKKSKYIIYMDNYNQEKYEKCKNETINKLNDINIILDKYYTDIKDVKIRENINELKKDLLNLIKKNLY